MANTGKKNLLLNKFAGIFRKFDSLDQVHDLLLAPAMAKRKTLDAAWFNWKSDEEFARQQVNGTR